MNDIDGQLLKQSLQEWTESLQWPFMMTFVLNPPCEWSEKNKILMAERKLNRFNQSVDKKLLGKNYYKRDWRERTNMIAVPEHIETNLHYHVLVNPAILRSDFEHLCEEQWNKICKEGSIEIIRNEENKRICSYLCKDQWKDKNFRSFRIYPEQ